MEAMLHGNNHRRDAVTVRKAGDAPAYRFVASSGRQIGRDMRGLGEVGCFYELLTGLGVLVAAGEGVDLNGMLQQYSGK